MTNGEKIKEIYPGTPIGVRLDVDGSNGALTFTTNTDWWNAEYKEPTTQDSIIINKDGYGQGYEKGLQDAWECARKIYNDLSMDKYIEIFEGKSWFFDYNASEAIAKIKEYEEKQTVQTRKSVMTLDEAIKHCEEVADSKCDECGAEHRQLAGWLRELKQMKGEEGIVKPYLDRLKENMSFLDTYDDIEVEDEFGNTNRTKYVDFYEVMETIDDLLSGEEE